MSGSKISARKPLKETNGLKAAHLHLAPQFCLGNPVDIIMRLLIFLFVGYLSSTLAYPQDSQAQYKAQLVTKTEVVKETKAPNYKKPNR